MTTMQINYSTFPIAAQYAIAKAAATEAIKTHKYKETADAYAVDVNDLQRWVNSERAGHLEEKFAPNKRKKNRQIEWRNVPNAPRMAVRQKAIAALTTDKNKSRVAKQFGTTSVTIKRWETWEKNGKHVYQKRGRKRLPIEPVVLK